MACAGPAQTDSAGDVAVCLYDACIGLSMLQYIAQCMCMPVRLTRAGWNLERKPVDGSTQNRVPCFNSVSNWALACCKLHGGSKNREIYALEVVPHLRIGGLLRWEIQLPPPVTYSAHCLHK